MHALELLFETRDALLCGVVEEARGLTAENEAAFATRVATVHCGGKGGGGGREGGRRQCEVRMYM